MHPLDLLKVKLQVATGPPKAGIGRQIWLSLKDIQQSQGWKGLYRGVGPNIAGNASSWGLYFLLCVSLVCSLQVLLTRFNDTAVVITCSNSTPRVVILPTKCPLEHTCYAPPKQVRIDPYDASPFDTDASLQALLRR